MHFRRGGEHKENRKERSERRFFALFHFVCILFLYLYCVSIDFCATERILFCLNPPPLPQRQFPKFQFSKIPIFQNSNFPKKPKKPKKNKKTNCARTLPHPLFPPWSVQNCFFCFFWFLWFFWKIGILENWNFGFFDFLGCFKCSISLEVDNTTTFSQFQNSL